jgi:hypothetical protein
MVAIGMVLIWGGYAIGIWGYCLVNGYDVAFTSLFGTAWVSGGSQPQQPGTLPLPVDPGTGTSLV